MFLNSVHLSDRSKLKVLTEDLDKLYKLRVLVIIIALTTTMLAVNNIIAVKIVTIMGYSLSASAFCYAFTFLSTDLISEIWGRNTANLMVIIGFLGNLLMLLVIKFALILPSASFWNNQESFDLVLGGVPRIVLAGMIAYLISQFHDVWAFHLWRRVSKGKHLWFRNNLSTFTSQVIDTVLFISIAFWGLFEPPVLIGMFVAQFLFKWGIAMADTPLIYLFVKLIGPPLPHAHPSYETDE